MDMGEIRIKHKDKDRDTYVIHWWEFQISVWRCFRSSELLLSCCLHPISPTPFHGWLYVRASPLSMATSHPLVKMVQMLCHSTANHLRFSIMLEQDSPPLLRLSLRPALASLKLVTVIQSQNPTQNTTDKVQTFQILMNAAINLAYSTKILIKRSKR